MHLEPSTSEKSHRDLVRQIIRKSRDLPPELEQKIVALGSEAVPHLIEILEDDALSRLASPGEGMGPVHAATLLGKIGDPRAVEPLLRVLQKVDPDDILDEKIIYALVGVGEGAVEPCLRELPTADHDTRISLTTALSELTVKDERIFQALLRMFEEERVIGAANLVGYGDERAIPVLLQAFDDIAKSTRRDLAYDELIEIGSGIRELGGTLAPAQELVLERAVERRKARFLPRLLMKSGMTKPERNDLCWCGSEKKYKKCHLPQES